MKIRIERGKLIDSLTHVIRSLGPKTTPILEMVKIVVSETNITLTASDMQSEMTATIENHENIAGECCVPGKRFAEVIKSARKDAFLTIELKNNFLAIKQGRILQKLKTLPSQDYPYFGHVEIDHQLVIASKTLLDMIHKVSPSMPKDDVRYYLNGLHMTIETDILALTATDGHRMSTIEFKTGLKLDEKLAIIIPQKSIVELVNILNEEESAEINFAEGKLQVNIDTLSLNLQLIDGRYPDYKRIIPPEHGITGTLTVNRHEMLNALNRAIPIIRDSPTKIVNLSFKEDGYLNLFVANPEQEESSEQIDATLSGATFNVSVNTYYLKDAFATINTKDVLINYSGPSTGLLITPDDEHFINVIMPIRT